MAESQKDRFRPLPNFPPSVWDCYFASFTPQDSEYEAYTNEVEQLKEEVKSEFSESRVNLISSIEFINLLCRLGVSYHFDSEIESQLHYIFNEVQNLNDKYDFDLYTVGVLFRVLRQHGYEMSCDVFNKLKNSDGEFNNDIANDVKGLLSLYQASFLSVHGEDILDEALDFSKKHLQTIVKKSKLKPHVVNHIRKSLEQPFHYGVHTIETYHYIAFYECEESRNETLLRFAKLDYNRLQLLYKKELSSISRWWIDVRAGELMPYARERLVEGYFWLLASIPRPESSLARIFSTKCLKLNSVMDDTFDTYGTLDELELFVPALERWNLDAIGELPNYMKDFFGIIKQTFAEVENHEDEGIRKKASCAKEMFVDLARCYLIEAKWIHDNDNVPRFHEYLKNGFSTTTYWALSSALMTQMDELDIKDYQWMQKNPKVFEATALIGRLMNDIKAHPVEWERKDIPLGMKSYMNEYNVSIEEAIIGIKKMCKDAWKDINEACMNPNGVSRILINISLNLARITDFTYNVGDSYTHGSDIKDAVKYLIIRPLQL